MFSLRTRNREFRLFFRGLPLLLFEVFCCEQSYLRLVRMISVLIRKELRVVCKNKALTRALPGSELFGSTNQYPN